MEDWTVGEIISAVLILGAMLYAGSYIIGFIRYCYGPVPKPPKENEKDEFDDINKLGMC